MLKRLWRDEGGAILTTELILIMVLTVIGLIVGLTALRDAVDYQLADLAGAIAAIDVSYYYEGLMYTAGNFTQVTGPRAYVADSAYQASFNVSQTSGIKLLSVYSAPNKTAGP